MAERGKIGISTSPRASTVAPSASTTATAPLWRLSTRLPRVTSTRTGLGITGRFLLRRNRVVATFYGSIFRRSGYRFAVEDANLVSIFAPVSHAMATRLKTLRLTMLVVFALPIAARGGLYAVADHPSSWRNANW